MFFLPIIFLLTLKVALAALPSKIYGVNLGGWLVLEPWILPQKWTAMGGQHCSCSKVGCIATESAFSKAYPATVDTTFADHWDTWFTTQDIRELNANGINTVRIPLGFWIIESLVDSSVESFPKGGIHHLRRGLRELRDAGISVMLDHHGLPGSQAVNEVFTGTCTSDPQFFTPYNYHRTLVWTAVMTVLSHLPDSDFDSVAALEAVNEPMRDAHRTPGFGEFQKNFVSTIRGVELILGMSVPGWSDCRIVRPNSRNISEVLDVASSSTHIFNQETKEAIKSAASVLLDVNNQLNFTSIYDYSPSQYRDKEILVTTFHDRTWQYNDPANAKEAERGVQVYDSHLYYCFGHVADNNEEAYLRHICNLDRVQRNADEGNSPLIFGEWSLGTQFHANESFLRKWADAQKIAYSAGAGWMFWNFKTEGTNRGITGAWSYQDAVRMGYLTKDPKELHDPNVCAPYLD